MKNNIEKIVILGSTGSIGVQTLEVIKKNNDIYDVYGISGHSNIELLFEQCKEFKPKYVVVTDASKYSLLEQKLKNSNLSTELLIGAEGLLELVAMDLVTQVVAAIVGGAGLNSIHTAVRAGKKLLLANKESLVMTGELLLDEAVKSGSIIMPIDSEHNALFQCLPEQQGFRIKSLADAGVSKLLLTGSGGPFRDTPLSELRNKTPAQACNHPNWSMGKKISVDSATMMNKGLEYIEAKLLFSAKPSEIGVLIHPQSIIHSLVQYKDGTSLAQIGYSDMRVPIAHCLAYPKRISSGVLDIDLTEFELSFKKVNYDRYPCLKLAMSVAENNSLSTVMNAANEISVAAFLDGKIKFTEIYETVAKIVEITDIIKIKSIEDVLFIDSLARMNTKNILKLS